MMLGYILYVRPMEAGYLTFLEAYNEATFLACLVCAINFTSYLPNTNFRYEIGWGFIAIVCANAIINVSVLFTMMVYYIMRPLRNKYNQLPQSSPVKKN